MNNNPHTCWITFNIKSSDDIAMRQRVPGATTTTKNMCSYRIYEQDWKPNESYAYDSKRSLDIVAKVDVLM